MGFPSVGFTLSFLFCLRWFFGLVCFSSCSGLFFGSSFWFPCFGLLFSLLAAGLRRLYLSVLFLFLWVISPVGPFPPRPHSLFRFPFSGLCAFFALPPISPPWGFRAFCAVCSFVLEPIDFSFLLYSFWISFFTHCLCGFFQFASLFFLVILVGDCLSWLGFGLYGIFLPRPWCCAHLYSSLSCFHPLTRFPCPPPLFVWRRCGASVPFCLSCVFSWPAIPGVLTPASLVPALFLWPP